MVTSLHSLTCNVTLLAGIIALAINNPRSWQFEEIRLEVLLQRRVEHTSDEVHDERAFYVITALSSLLGAIIFFFFRFVAIRALRTSYDVIQQHELSLLRGGEQYL